VGLVVESELFHKIMEDPNNWPFYAILALLIVVAFQTIQIITNTFVKPIIENLSHQKGILFVLKTTLQVVAISMLIYIANALYWSQTIEKILPSPEKKPIYACEITIEIVVDSNRKSGSHFMDRGGYFGFINSEDKPILNTFSTDSYGRSVADNEYQYRAVLKMDAADSAVGLPVNILSDTAYYLAMIRSAPEDYSLIRGKAICIVNNEIRFEVIFSPQEVKGGLITSKNIETLQSLYNNH